jgi:puromycin-sensitive aminopeptidase
LLEKIVPENYRLNLDVDMEQFRYRALEEISFELKQPSRELTFHGAGLKVTLAELEGQKASVSVNEGDQTVTFAFGEEVPAGQQTLSVAFTGEIRESLHGFYRSKYEHEGNEKWLVTTQLEAIHAREAFVCIDEPAAKAVFELSLTVPDQLVAIANTNVVGEQPAGQGLKKVQFAPTPKMSTYLVAFMVGEFEHAEETTPEGVTVRVYATPGKTGQLAFALDVAVRTLSFFDKYFGIPYPLPKLDMIAVPDFAAGAMENWGAVTYRETALLIDPAQTGLAAKQRVAEVVAHELAHQWFGNLVTMAWWDDLWLNEGFATWVAALARDHLFPEWQVWTQFIEEEFAQALEMDSLANTHPIQVPVDDPRGLDEIFDAISYAKGASVINMLHHYLGAEDFKRGLHDYLEKHSFGNSVTHDLWSALGAASGKPVDKVMSAWTGQPGYPVLAFEDGNVIQRRFYASPREAEKAKLAKGLTWPVPFGALLAGGTETEPALVEVETEELPDEVMASDWFKPNPGQTGVYRSQYTEPMIEALTKPLHTGTLSPVDRFGVVDDVFATTEAGLTDSMVALKLVEAMRDETDYVVWGGVTGGFGSLESIVEDEPLRESLDKFGRWLVQPNVERLGWQPKPGENAFDTLMRPLVLSQAVRFDDEAVTKEARKRFRGYLEGEAVDPDLRSAILYSAARHGDTDDFEAILERYRKEQIPQVKMSLLGTLCRFRKPKLIDRFLELGLSDDVRSQDIYIVLAWGFRNREGRAKTWQWLKDNWKLFEKRYGAGGHMLERFPLYAGSGFATHAMAAEIKEFFGAHPMPATKRPTAQAVEGVELKADWYSRDKLKIKNFVDDWAARQG